MGDDVKGKRNMRREIFMEWRQRNRERLINTMWHETVWVRHEQDYKRGMAWGQKWGMVVHEDRAWQYHSDFLKAKVYLPSYRSITGQPSFSYLAQACSLPKVTNLSSGEIKIRQDGFSFSEFKPNTMAPKSDYYPVIFTEESSKGARQRNRWISHLVTVLYEPKLPQLLYRQFEISVHFTPTWYSHFYSHLRKEIEAQRGYFAQENLFG